MDLPASRATAAWCLVDVARDDADLRVEVGGCSDGYAAAAAETVRSWTFSEGTDRFRLVLAFHDAEMHFY